MNNNFTEFLRNEWSSFLKWTAGISTLLISFTLTIIVLKKCLSTINTISACTTISLLVIAIILIWTLLKYTISLIYVPFDKMYKGEAVTEKEEAKKNILVNIAKPWEIIIYFIFLSGVVSFMVFFLSVIFKW